MTTWHEVSRRSLLAGGAGALTLAVVRIPASFATTPDPFSFKAWTPLVGKTMKTDTGTELRLDRVVDLRKPPVKGEVASNADRYRLHFQVTAGTLGPGLITIIHPAAEPVILFMTRGPGTAVASIDRRGANMLPTKH
ncbi:hypothetical protein [Specibacter sp. RAF43]|uniref:hypothetical protein n=1 Tax=Specibacter sp. RAF43 TaxID=3233057 RepID=UPI003F9B02E0